MAMVYIAFLFDLKALYNLLTRRRLGKILSWFISVMIQITTFKTTAVEAVATCTSSPPSSTDTHRPPNLGLVVGLTADSGNDGG